MTFWFFVLGIPLFGYGLFTVVRPKEATRFLLAFPRNRIAGQALCAAAWLWTAYEIDTIGIEVFDRIVRRLWFLSSDIPGMVWILAIILPVLTCLGMENLLSIRALSALFRLCRKDNLHAIWAIEDLYRPGNSRELFFGILENCQRKMKTRPPEKLKTRPLGG